MGSNAEGVNLEVGGILLVMTEQVKEGIVVVMFCFFLELRHYEDSCLNQSPFLHVDGSDLEVFIEAANGLIDMYSEDNMHTQNIQQLQLLARLAACIPTQKQVGIIPHVFILQ